LATDAIIVVPCYNEAARLDVEAFRRFAANHGQRLLLVNDGSTDATLAVLERLSAADPQHFLLHSLERNCGKAEAVRQGVLRALERQCDVIGYWDADLATPLDDIPRFQEFLETHPQVQVVMGARVRLLGRHVERRLLRHYLGRAFATVASFTVGLPVYDTQCGAKLFRVTPETVRLFAEPFRTNWIFDVEILARFVRDRKAAGQSAETAIYEWPLDCWRDVAGSKVRARDFFRALFGMAVIYWDYLRPGARRSSDGRKKT
jgi:glycosyltransferase involved in cell wall biosynthesis